MHIYLGPDEELFEVVARVILAQRGQVVHDSPVRQHHLEPQHGAVQRAVTEEAQAARVGRDVAADLARALGAQVERHRVAALPHVVLQHLEHAARLADQVARILVERDDLVQPPQRDYHLIIDRNRAADQARVASLRHHRDAALVAVGEDLRDLQGRARTQRQLGLALIFAHPVRVVQLERCRVGYHVRAAHDRCEVLDVELAQRRRLAAQEARQRAAQWPAAQAERAAHGWH